MVRKSEIYILLNDYEPIKREIKVVKVQGTERVAL